jgi:hypothetical protein
MATRLGLTAVFTFGVVLVVACGSSGDGPATSTGGDAGGTDGSSSTNPDGNTANGGAALCDPAAATACSNGRKCDPALGCVECVADGDCTAAGRDPFCILGRCEACRTNTDCGAAAPACYPGDHQCHASCAVDGGAKCDGDAPLCDATTGACVGCNGSTDCPATEPLCEPTTKSCVSCTTNANCPAARPRCLIPRFECVECVISADCGANRVCNDGSCEAGCTSDQQCTDAKEPKCNVATARCSQCVAAADCAGVAGRPLCATQGDRAGRCVQCTTSAECGDGGTPFCGDNGTCEQCLNDKDCPGVDGKCDNGECK